MHILAAQPEPMAGSMAGALTLEPVGRQGGGDTFCLINSLILELSAFAIFSHFWAHFYNF